MEKLNTAQMIDGTITIFSQRLVNVTDIYNSEVEDVYHSASSEMHIAMNTDRIASSIRRMKGAEALIREYNDILSLLRQIKETYSEECGEE